MSDVATPDRYLWITMLLDADRMDEDRNVIAEIMDAIAGDATDETDPMIVLSSHELTAEEFQNELQDAAAELRGAGWLVLRPEEVPSVRPGTC